MREQQEQIKQLKLVTGVLLLTFLSITVILAVTLRSVTREAAENRNKVDALIDEVGELKQEKDFLYDIYLSDKDRLSEIRDGLRKISVSINEHLSGDEQLIEEINAANEKLQGELKSKELSIAALAQKNVSLKEEIVSSTYAPEIIDIAVIGQNAGLTDAIMIMSINPATKKISLVSIPRDLYHKGRKINEIFNYYGIEKLKETIAEVTGITVDKYLIFDFSSFVAVIDRFGGVDVNVGKAFVDDQYPGPDHSYIKISFAAGPQHMDGEKALKYVRSRKTTSDFDRSRRQQEVLQSLRDKLSDFDVVKNFDTVAGIYSDISSGIKSDISLFDAIAMYGNTKGFSIKSGNVISNRNYLYTSISKTGQYILLPVNGSYAALKKYINELVNS
jgi:LCP family protein required for cell wall assembly